MPLNLDTNAVQKRCNPAAVPPKPTKTNRHGALRKLVGFGVFRWVLVGFGGQVSKKAKKRPSFCAPSKPLSATQRTKQGQNFSAETLVKSTPRIASALVLHGATNS